MTPDNLFSPIEQLQITSGLLAKYTNRIYIDVTYWLIVQVSLEYRELLGRVGFTHHFDRLFF